MSDHDEVPSGRRAGGDPEAPRNERERNRRDRRALAIVERALALDGEARSAYLDRSCAGDPTLRATVVAILRRGATADGVLVPGAALDGPLAAELAAPTGAPKTGPAAAVPPPRVGDRVGPFRLLREIGRGGMGVVFLAERVDGHFEQRVALKLLPAGGDPDLARRLEEERRILATLEHPGIARLLDGGVTAGGQPYLAMEYVEGRPVDRYCAEEGLDLESRLELFRSICEAVQAAHQRLVVHRDLKPSNILVTADGQVKLLDFGIARIVSQDASQRSMTIALTFGYASPEQFQGDAITVATDVYQLGVLLYELLTGERPFDDAGTSWLDQAQAVLERDPVPPSERLRRAGRRSRARRVRGDLDHVALEALAREPERRYRSVDRLRDDVERHLAGHPVAARRGGSIYRLRKLLRRHAVAAGAAAGVALVIASLVTFYTLRLADERDRARQALAVAERERAATQQARDEAEEVAAFLGDLFAGSDPRQAQGRDPTARELLDRGAERIEGDLAGRPRVQARMMRTIGDVYRQLGLYPRAEPLLRRALERSRAGAGNDAAGLVESLVSLGRLRTEQGRLDEAGELFRQALAETAADRPDLRLLVLSGLGGLVFEQGRFGEAVEIFTRVLELREEAVGDRHPSVAVDVSNLANAFGRQRRYGRAEQLYRQAIDLLAGGEDPQAQALALSNLGSLLAEQRRFAEAEPLLRRGAEIRERLLGSDHPDVALDLSNLASLLLDLGRYQEAGELFRRCLAILETKAPEHRVYTQALGNYGNLLLAQEDFQGARGVYEHVLDLQESRLGAEHPALAFTLNNLGEALIALDRPGQARGHLERSLAIFESVAGGESLLASWPLFNLGRVHRALGDPETAEALLRRALAIRESGLAEGAEEIGEVCAELRHLPGDPPQPCG
jgi:serine/threonine-protein kinase